MNENETSIVLRPIQKTDQRSIGQLWEPDKHWLGGFGPAWYRFWTTTNPRHQWWIAENGKQPIGFIHFHRRRDGIVSVYEIAVAGQARGCGVGRRLMELAGAKVRLKTDVDNHHSNAFYQRLKFVREGTVRSRNGKRLLNVYAKW